MPDVNHPLAEKVRREMVRAIAGYSMIEAGDKVMVCVSGGKDSAILLTLLNEIRIRAPYEFTIVAVALDQKQPGYTAELFRSWVEQQGIDFVLLQEDTYSIVKAKISGGTYCSLCSRLRRGILYRFAKENGFTKMALGHHADDLIETLFLNIFYTGKLASMPPKLRSDSGENVVIRPLSLVAESDLRELSQLWNIPLIPCNLCGSQEGLKRAEMKKLLVQLEAEIPFIRKSVLTALSNVKPSQLMDKSIWDFSIFQTLAVHDIQEPMPTNDIFP
jgi:tRNA 2-thiocytidine biosynthesis protein TtcA